jgi:cytochrome c-type biogenesis protein CcmH
MTANSTTLVRTPLRRTWRPWLPLLLVVVVALGVGVAGSTGPATNGDRVFAVASQIKCPVCNGETVAESNVEISREIRDDIARRVDQGQTDEQILDFVDAKYQDQHLILTPSASGFVGLIWVLPVVALVIALAGLAVAFRRWRLPVGDRADEADRDLVAEAMTHLDDGSGRS